MAALPDGLEDRFPSLRWGEAEWLAAMHADGSLTDDILRGLAGLPPTRRRDELVSIPTPTLPTDRELAIRRGRQMRNNGISLTECAARTGVTKEEIVSGVPQPGPPRPGPPPVRPGPPPTAGAEPPRKTRVQAGLESPVASTRRLAERIRADLEKLTEALVAEDEKRRAAEAREREVREAELVVERLERELTDARERLRVARGDKPSPAKPRRGKSRDDWTPAEREMREARAQKMRDVRAWYAEQGRPIKSKAFFLPRAYVEEYDAAHLAAEPVSVPA